MRINARDKYYAFIKHGLGMSDPKKIGLIKLGWQKDILI